MDGRFFDIESDIIVRIQVPYGIPWLSGFSCQLVLKTFRVDYRVLKHLCTLSGQINGVQLAPNCFNNEAFLCWSIKLCNYLPDTQITESFKVHQPWNNKVTAQIYEPSSNNVCTIICCKYYCAMNWNTNDQVCCWCVVWVVSGGDSVNAAI